MCIRPFCESYCFLPRLPPISHVAAEKAAPVRCGAASIRIDDRLYSFDTAKQPPFVSSCSRTQIKALQLLLPPMGSEPRSILASNNEDPKGPLLPQLEGAPPSTTKSRFTDLIASTIFERAFFAVYILAILSIHIFTIFFSPASSVCGNDYILMGLDAIRCSSFHAVVLVPVFWLTKGLWDQKEIKAHRKWLLGVWLFVWGCMWYFARFFSMDTLFMTTCRLGKTEG